MALTRKKYIVDKKFQVGISIKAIIFPLATTFIISIILLYFANINDSLIQSNNEYIETIVSNQDKMIDMFLSTPNLQNSNNPDIKDGADTFKKNIGYLKKISHNSITIKDNSSKFFYIIILLTIIQTIVIFSIFILASHRISGPIHVMTQHLKNIQNGEEPDFRPLRKKDKLKDFYEELRKTIDSIKNGH